MLAGWRKLLVFSSHWSRCCRFCSTFQHVLHGQGTIFALSSGHGRAGVAIIRVSGPAASESLSRMVKKIPVPRKAVVRKIFYPSSSEAIDKGLVLWFPGPGSFTGEDCAEFHVHGGAAVVSAILIALGSLPGYRHAEAGEFTKRAFMNGRLDLTEVEGLADLIAAETEAQRRQALRQMDGDLSNLYLSWRKRIIKCLANVEAYIDFSEDENIEDDVLDHANSDIKRMCAEMQSHLSDNRQGERLRSGVHVVIIGEPNVGKSSLLNALCQRPAAIVSPIAGTTRDVIETALNIGGYPVLLSDTAGLREAVDEVEKEGVYRAVNRAESADIKILLLDVSKEATKLSGTNLFAFTKTKFQRLGINTCENNLDDNAARISVDSVESHTKSQSETIVVFNKCDLVPSWNPCFEESDVQVAAVSCMTGSGMDSFVQLLAERVKNVCGNPLSGNPSLTQVRHRSHLKKCLEHLQLYLHLSQDNDVVLAAQRLRKASHELGRINGVITSEDILDVIFKDFCIGK